MKGFCWVALVFAWLYFVLGSLMNFQILLVIRNAKEGERIPSGSPFVPGILGVIAVFFTLPELAKHGITVPWPFFWIVLPLFLDASCVLLGTFMAIGFVKEKVFDRK